jgi:hypothetical protein
MEIAEVAEGTYDLTVVIAPKRGCAGGGNAVDPDIERKYLVAQTPKTFVLNILVV